MSMMLEGTLADRSTWTLDACSIAMSMDAVGSRSSMLILREALWGTTRFDDFARRTKLTEANVAKRLKQLTELGIFTKQPYQEEGRRTRHEYALTPKGRDLMPAVLALMQWGNKHLQADEGPLHLVVRGTGDPVVIGAQTATGRSVALDDVAIVANGDWPESR